MLLSLAFLSNFAMASPATPAGCEDALLSQQLVAVVHESLQSGAIHLDHLRSHLDAGTGLFDRASSPNQLLLAQAYTELRQKLTDPNATRLALERLWQEQSATQTVNSEGLQKNEAVLGLREQSRISNQVGAMQVLIHDSGFYQVAYATTSGVEIHRGNVQKLFLLPDELPDGSRIDKIFGTALAADRHGKPRLVFEVGAKNNSGRTATAWRIEAEIDFENQKLLAFEFHPYALLNGVVDYRLVLTHRMEIPGQDLIVTLSQWHDQDHHRINDSLHWSSEGQFYFVKLPGGQEFQSIGPLMLFRRNHENFALDFRNPKQVAGSENHFPAADIGPRLPSKIVYDTERAHAVVMKYDDDFGFKIIRHPSNAVHVIPGTILPTFKNQQQVCSLAVDGDRLIAAFISHDRKPRGTSASCLEAWFDLESDNPRQVFLPFAFWASPDEVMLAWAIRRNRSPLLFVASRDLLQVFDPENSSAPVNEVKFESGIRGGFGHAITPIVHPNDDVELLYTLNSSTILFKVFGRP